MVEETPYQRRLCWAIGDVYSGRRTELGFTQTELADYLSVFWNERPAGIAKIIIHVQQGYGLGMEFISERKERENLEKIQEIL